MPRFITVLVALLSLIAAAEYGVSLERDSPLHAADRERLAKTLYFHNFENIRDPDSGRLLPESAAINAEMWPDFWEPVRAVGFPEYLIPSVRIVADNSGVIPGAYRDAPNHALMIEYDGTRVGLRTRFPVPVDPSLAYQYSIRVRDRGLSGARVRTGVDWLRIDSSATQLLRSDEIPDLGAGQLDWPIAPARMLVNDPPPGANAARMFIIVDRDPDSIGGAYHGTVWLDDVSLKPLPKIIIDAPRDAADGDGRVIPVRYAGLFDNIPDPANPGYFRGRRYARQVEVTDVFGKPMQTVGNARQTIEADDDGAAVEDIPFPRGRYGVYYFNIRLYDAAGRLATDVMRAVAVMRPGRQREGVALHASKPVFGISAGMIPESALASNGFLRAILERSHVKLTKLSPWPDKYAEAGSNAVYYSLLAEEIRTLRAAGLGVYGIVRPPSAMFGSSDMFTAASTQPQRLRDLIAEAGRHLGLFLDGWQWGDDNDASLQSVSPGPALDGIGGALREFAGGLPVVNNVTLDGTATPGFPLRQSITQGYLREDDAAPELWPLAARTFPWLYEPYFDQRGLIYPPLRLSVLAPQPAQDKLEEYARSQSRVGSWISLEARPAYTHEPNAPAERKQLEDLAVRAVYASALAPDAIYLGNLFDPVHGLLRRDVMGTNTLETMARPTYLAAATLSDVLEGADYLGELWLLPPFEAHVFRKRGTDESVIVVWHNDARDEVMLPRQEIANGPALQVMDWAGNVDPAGSQIPVRRVPTFITGLSANLVLTRMSMRINPEMSPRAAMRRQNQTLELVNHLPRQTPVLARLRYAARLPGGAMENGWTLKPEEMRFNLAPFTPQLTPGRIRYTVTPDPNSQIQIASPAGVDKSGAKIARVDASFNTSPPADMLIYLPFNLRSDLDVEVEQLERLNDPQFVTLQLKLRWFPSEPGSRRNEIKLTPYYSKRGQMKESAAFPVAVKAFPVEERGTDVPFEAVELRIPIRPQAQTWVGLEEVGGSNFYIIDVTDYLSAE